MSKAQELLDNLGEGFKGFVFNKKLKGVKVKVPSFTFTADVTVGKAKYDNPRDRLIQQEIDISIESFKNEVQDILDKKVANAVAKAIADQIPVELNLRNINVGGHACIFPQDFHIGEKKNKL